MLSFPKKLSDKETGTGMSPWHPNFRNFEKLPDTKAVRTSFFVNFIAILVVLALVSYVTYRELDVASLSKETLNAQNTYEKMKPDSDQALALYKKFQEQEVAILGLKEFIGPASFVFSDFLLRLGKTLPPGFSLSSVEYTAGSIVIRGGIIGSAEEASGRAVKYVDALRDDAVLTKIFDGVTLANIARDSATGQIRFEINIKLQPSVVRQQQGGKK